jgi:hypothetical protein
MKKSAAIILPLIAAIAFPQSAIAQVANRDALNNIIAYIPLN